MPSDPDNTPSNPNSTGDAAAGQPPPIPPDASSVSSPPPRDDIPPAFQPPPPPPPPFHAQPEPSFEDIREGKVLAVLSYLLSIVSLPFFVIPLLLRTNAFALYHAKQVLMLWIVAIAMGLVVSTPTVCAIVFPPIACITIPAAIALGIFLLVLLILGTMNAANGIIKPLPLFGDLAERWFASIRKVG